MIVLSWSSALAAVVTATFGAAHDDKIVCLPCNASVSVTSSLMKHCMTETYSHPIAQTSTKRMSYLRCKSRVIMMPGFQRTYAATSDDEFGIITTLGIRYFLCLQNSDYCFGKSVAI